MVDVEKQRPSSELEDALDYTPTPDKYLVKFDDDDPNKPMNWATSKKIVHVALYGLTTCAAQFNSTSMTSVALQLMKSFGISQTVATLATSLYVLGIALGPMCFAPLSEVYGRKYTVLMPFGISLALTLGTASSKTISAILCTRFFAGIFASSAVVNAGGVMADIFAPAQRGSIMVIYSYFVVCGPTFSPLITSALVEANGSDWAWACWFSCMFCGVVLLLGLFTMDETYAPVLLKAKAKQLRLKTKNWQYHAAQEQWQLTAKDFVKIHLARPFAMLATPILFFVALYASFVFGILYLATTSIAFTFQQGRGWGNIASQTPMISLCIGLILGGALIIFSNRRYARLVSENGGKSLPEERFALMLFVSWLMPGGLFIFAWTSSPDIHWICPMIGLAVMGFSFLTIFQGCLNYLVDAFTKYAASAIAANTFGRSLLGAIFPLFGHYLFDNLGVEWGASTLAFISLGMIPIPFIFYFFGRQIRAKNPYNNLIN